MLKLSNIRKEYKTFDFTQVALDGVSVSFRDNEFAAILGPSGSGKTTMLNIIGGLDHYDSGEMEIDGIPTEKYKSSDWDTYRNNRIGFVFQSYNLITHQSVLANVELALTLVGVPRDERRRRALDALEEVGLKEHARKLPNQLSGGQMQRVALARALINDPEILLADEPTGALDTKTGEQMMDLLQEIAKDRLVIMVTHNPELADRYANRIIQLQDGVIVSDTNPLNLDEDDQRKGRSPRKVSMSFFTAISLSLSNLMTKKGRTFVTALAGSIGIVGIAAILALSNGINAYIAESEEEAMSVYPMTIQSSGFDMTSLFDNMMGPTENSESEDDEENQQKNNEKEVVKERKIVESLFENQTQNDLKSLKAYISENENNVTPYVNNIQYTYDLTPQIYLGDVSDGVDQVNPDALLRSRGIGSGMDMGALMGMSGGMNMYYEMPGGIEMFDFQYDVVAGNWPQNYDEAVVVLAPGGSVSDYLLYSMGIRDRTELKNMLDAVINNPEDNVEIKSEDLTVTYSKLLETKLKVVNAADRYEYDENFNVWIDKSDHKDFMKNLVSNSMDLKIVGIVMPNPDVSATSLSIGINYTPDLIYHLMDEAAKKKIVQDQLSNQDVNVITGKTFAEEKEDDADNGLDFAELISVDEDAMSEAFKFDESKINMDMSGLGDAMSMDMSGLSGLGNGISLDSLDFSNLSLEMPSMDNIQMPEFNIEELTGAIAGQINIPEEALTNIMQSVIAGFLAEVATQGPMQPEQFIEAFTNYLAKPEVQASINAQLGSLLGDTQIQSVIQDALQTYMTGAMESFSKQFSEQMASMQTELQNQIQLQMQTVMGAIMSQIQTQMESAFSELPKQIQSQMGKAMADFPNQIQNAISIDENGIASAFKIEMSEDDIMDLMSTMMNQQETTAQTNLTLLGYATPDSPSQINFYPTSFEGKTNLVDFIEQYNRNMESNGEDDKVISYSDLFGVLMASVIDIVDTISYALIAFVAISLVVSSIMIGVITYISVLERKKEIGILRAVGASKRDVRRVFNAETLIIGFIAGVIGIAITEVASVIANIIVEDRLDIKNIAQLSWENAAILIGVSMLLAFISGFFPSTAAARKDPVEALRSE